MASIQIVPVASKSRALRWEFIRLPHRLYAGNPNWVPSFNIDMQNMLRKRHPYFRAYPADFFLAAREGQTVGRLCVSYNRNYVNQHEINAANFFFFETIDDVEVARELFRAGEQWARDHGADTLIGPMLSGGAVGSGILIEGFEYPAPMTMMRYNYPYYGDILSELNFEKYVDLISLLIDGTQYVLSPKLTSIADKVRKRGNFSVVQVRSHRQLKKFATQCTFMYNDLLGDHPENYPLTPAEMKQMLKDTLLIARRDLIKVLFYKDAIVGFLIAFPNITEALQRSKGRITPRSLIDIKRSINKRDKLIFNGVGILPQYQRLGGNALMYVELYNTLVKYRVQMAEMTQIAETTALMLEDASTIGAKKCKVHRIFRKPL